MHYGLKLTTRRLVLCGVLIAAGAVLPTGLAADDGPTPEQIVAKHLAALGSPEARKAAKHRVSQGEARVQVLGGSFGDLRGPTAYATDGLKELFQIQFGNTNYPREEFSYDGNKVYVPRVVPEGYSRLGEFIRTYNYIVKEGMLGGSLSTGWAFLDIEKRKPKMEYAGLKEVDGKQLHRVSYRPRKDSGDLKIYVYFEPETFRHVMTTYEFYLKSGMRTSADAGGQSAGIEASEAMTRMKLTEKFSEFQSVDGLTLPTKWYIEHVVESNQGRGGGVSGVQYEWTIKFNSIDHNMEINPSAFVIDR